MTIQSQEALYEEQLRLEQESLMSGSTRYIRMLSKKRGKGLEAQTGPGHKLVMESVDATAQAIRQFVEEANTGRPGKRHAALKYIRDMDVHALAYLTATVCVNALTMETPKLTGVAIALGNEVENEINFSMLNREHPALHKVIQRRLKTSTSPRHARAVMRHHAAYAASEQRLILPDKEVLLIGTKLIELFVEATGLIELTLKRTGKTQKLWTLTANQKILDWLTKAHESAALFRPALLPMVVPPRPWTTPTDGGYLSGAVRRADLVRTRNRAYKHELEQADMPLVYAAVNAIQATPWKINRPVLDVLETLWEAGGGEAGLPERELLPMPEKPSLLEQDPAYYKAHHRNEFYAWKRQRASVWETNARNVSKTVAAYQKLKLARQFADYPAIWFPCNLDFRGRVYPLPPVLNPQGDDIAKGLLCFAEGVPLGEDGAYWLAIHLANMFGVDKQTFEARIAWVHVHEEQILDSAFDPLYGQRFWMDAVFPVLRPGRVY